MPREKGAVLFTLLSASFLSAFMGSSLNVALPAISAEYNMSAVITGWVASSFLLATAVAVLPAGRLADLKGRKRIFIIGIILNAAASLLSVLSPGQWFLIACRAVQGIGGAMMFATVNPILITAFPPQQRGRVLGFSVGAVYAGLSAGPFLGGILTQHAGWRAVFYFNALALLIVLYMALRYIEHEHPQSNGEPFDWAGSIVNGVFVSSLILAMTFVPSKISIILFTVSAAAGILFVVMQMKEPHPILKLSLLKGNSVFVKSNIAAMINYSATFAVAFLLSLYLQYVKGYTPQHAGMVLLWQPVVQACFSPLAGKMSDKIEPRLLASAGMALISAVLIFFIFLSPETPVVFIIISLVVLGAGFALFSSPNTNAVMGAVTHRDLGMASALLSTMRVFGQILSMGIAMLMFSLIIGNAKIDAGHADAFLHASEYSFVVFAALCLAGIYFSMSRGRVHEKEGTKSTKGTSQW